MDFVLGLVKSALACEYREGSPGGSMLRGEELMLLARATQADRLRARRVGIANL